MVCSSSICLLLPQWFVFPTRMKTQGSFIYFWKRSKKSVHLIKHIVIWRYDVKKVLDDAHIKVYFQWICRQGNPRTWHSNWHGSTNREYPIPYTCMMTTWVSCYSDNGKPGFKRCNLQAKWLCDRQTSDSNLCGKDNAEPFPNRWSPYLLFWVAALTHGVWNMFL